MPKFSDLSIQRLRTCHIELQSIFFEVIKFWDCSVLEGFRNEELQNKAFKDGASKLRWPYGKHNQIPSLAVDVAPYPTPKWDNVKDFIYFAGFVQGTAQKLYENGKIHKKIRYGGDWNSNKRITDENFQDLVHFELIT